MLAAACGGDRVINQVEIKIYKQRVKHLLYEQQNDVTSENMSAEVSLKLAQVTNIKHRRGSVLYCQTGDDAVDCGMLRVYCWRVTAGCSIVGGIVRVVL